MMLGVVIASVVSPTKHSGLEGSKLLYVKLSDGAKVLALDAVGAGVGSRVIVASGSHAVSIVRPQAPVDLVIVGILDGSIPIPGE